MITTIDAHQMFAVRGSGGWNSFEGVVAVCHGVCGVVGENAESVGLGQIF